MISFKILLGASVVLAANRTTAPDGCLHVAKSGGTHSTIQAAVDSLPIKSTVAQCLFIDQGIYNEQVNIVKRKAQLTIYGYTENTTSYAGNKATITFNAAASAAGGNDESGTVRVAAANFEMYNVNVVNSYGKKEEQSQAIALSAQAASGYFGCTFYGFQDTLLSEKGNQYYKNCLITGATDFIFGQYAVAWFETCDLRVRDGGHYITANGRDKSTNPSWYIFNGGTIDTADKESVAAGSIFLGRPWYPFSRTVFQNTFMSSIINPAGWSPWKPDDDLSNVYYREYNNTGPGSGGSRAEWAGKLRAPLDIKSFFGSNFTEGHYDGFHN